MMKTLMALASLMAVLTLASTDAAAQSTDAGQRPRLIVTADPELDDSNSLIRYLLHATDYRTEALIYASSQFHWRGNGEGTQWFAPGREYRRFGANLCPCTSWRWAQGERFIDDVVDAYAEAYPNLVVHDARYPTPDYLRARIFWGNVEFDGDVTEDTPGSNVIRALLLDDDPAPLHLLAWGGQSTIARALLSIEEEYGGTPQWAAIRERIVAKAAISSSGDQDGTYAGYIASRWADIPYNGFIRAVPLGYGAYSNTSESDSAYFSPEWTRENVSSRGPLGEMYRVWGDGRQMVEGDIFDFFHLSGFTAEQLRAQGYAVWTSIEPAGAFIGEGDTPTFLNYADNGLRGWAYGGWGGHRRPAQTPPPLADAFSPNAPSQQPARTRAPTHPFLAAAQNELAARFRWAVTSNYAGANHPPRLTLSGAHERTAARGQSIDLHVTADDPDGDSVTIRWRQWREAGTYAGDADVTQTQAGAARATVPAGANPGDTIHLIAEATDSGAPAFTRYAHVVLTVAP